ncbi:MAG: stalk domain-containing protein, partial [Tumebacillaceae bacterium]
MCNWGKALLCLLLGSAMGTAIPAHVSAATKAPLTIYIDNHKQQYDVEPYDKNNRVLVPLRAIFESLGAQVSWSKERPLEIVAKKGDVTVAMTINS